MKATNTRGNTRSRSGVLASGIAALVLVLSVSACSGDTDGADGAGDGAGGDVTSSTGNADDAAVQQRQCLREHGVDVPEPKPGEDGRGLTIGGDMSQEEFQEAFEACGGGGPEGSGSGAGEITQADKDMMLEYARCMRENGYDMPDPTFDGSSTQAQRMPQGAEKETFDKAGKACADIIR